MSRKLENWFDAYLEYSSRSEPPELYKEWTAVGLIAGVLRRQVWVNWDGLLFPNQYILLVGPPAARKGTALKRGKSVLGTDLLDELPKTMGRITPQALYQRLFESADSLTGMDPSYDSSIQSTNFVLSDEFTVFLAPSKEQTDSFVDNLCDLYDSPRNWEYTTKGDGKQEVKGVCMTMLGATTPEALRSTLPGRAIGGGLTSRMILVWGDRRSKLVKRPSLTQSEERLCKKLQHDLSQIGKLRGQFKLTEEWLTLYDKFYEHSVDVPAIEDRRFEHYNERRQIHLIKLCMCLSVARDDELVLDGDIFERAHTLLRKTEKLMPNCLSGFGNSPWSHLLRPVLDYLKHHTEGMGDENRRLPYSIVYSNFHDDLAPRAFDELLSTLEKINAVRVYVDEGRRWIHFTEAEFKNTRDKLKERRQLPG